MESALHRPLTRHWRLLVGLQREVEATSWGGFLLGNVWPAYVFALPLAARVVGFSQTRPGDSLDQQARWLQELVTVAFLALVVVLFAIRRRTIAGERSTLWPGLVALSGTFLLNVVAYLPIDETSSTPVLLAASGAIVLGTLFTTWSLATLGRCFGLLPEVRGLVLSGPYRIVRHPVYLGELTSAFGLLMARPHVVVAAGFVLFAVLQYARTVFEERALRTAYPDVYPEYARQVPRWLPGLRRIPWPAALTFGAFALCALPYVLSALAGPPELDRLGTFWFNHDFSQYQAAMREGARSDSWLIHDHFSAEPHAAVLMYPLYVAAGKLASLIHVSELALFSAMEWLGRGAVLGALSAFAASFTDDRRARRLAVILAVGTLGLDVWAVGLRVLLEALGLSGVAQGLPAEINPYLEVSSFGVLLSAPHLMFGLALTIVCAPLYLRAIRDEYRALALLAAAVVALSLVHTFNVPVLASVLVAHALVSGRRAWMAAIVVIVAALPMTAYSALVFTRDPFWAGTYGAQNLMPAPAPWALPFDFGLVLISAPLAWPVVRAWPAERRWLMLVWVALGLLWMYTPVAFQRRLSFGVQPALAVLCAVGLLHVNAWLRAHRVDAFRRRAVNYAAALAAVSTSLLVYVSLLSSALFDRPTSIYLWTKAEANAAAWLGDHSSTDDVVLASTLFANPLAGAIDGRVVQGHNVATLRNRDKEQAVWAFYSAGAPVAERQRLLRDSGATLVALGPHERALGATSFDGLSGLDLAYDRDGVQIYRVER